jgi:two-component system alkaline phosphatase synthesis response regulator PhoP
MKVLIVDDDKNMLNLLKIYLEDDKFDVIESRNGEEAFRIVLKEKPDIAIIDGLLPGIHGFELCKKIKKEPSLTPKPIIIIMSSVYKGIKYEMEAKKDFLAEEYLAKPFKKDDLLSKIESLLR